MVIHIANREADAIVRELARRWNTTLTKAVRISVIHALKLLICDRAWGRLKYDRAWAALKVRARLRRTQARA
jgi:hypothetical protein